MSDYLIDDASVHFNASKNLAYRRGVVAHFGTIINYLQTRGLTRRQILGAGEVPNSTTKIMASDLTDEGKLLMRQTYDRWLKSIDDKEPPFDTSMLDMALQQIRGVNRDR